MSITIRTLFFLYKYGSQHKFTRFCRAKSPSLGASHGMGGKYSLWSENEFREKSVARYGLSTNTKNENKKQAKHEVRKKTEAQDTDIVSANHNFENLMRRRT